MYQFLFLEMSLFFFRIELFVNLTVSDFYFIIIIISSESYYYQITLFFYDLQTTVRGEGRRGVWGNGREICMS